MHFQNRGSQAVRLPEECRVSDPVFDLVDEVGDVGR